MAPHRERRCGFTLVELMVVMAVIAILLALLMPAVMNVREAARRTQCANRLRQLGVALHQHHTQSGHFPTGYRQEWSWSSQVLPHLEQTSVHGQIEFQFEPFESPNVEQTRTVVPVLICASDPRGNSVHKAMAVAGQQFAHTNFLGTWASDSGGGMFREESRPVRLSEVIDGTSNTLFVGERPVADDGIRTRGWWVWGSAGDTMLRGEEGLRRGDAQQLDAAKHFWSYHSGGANFLLVDGSVHFLSYGIDPTTFVSLSTKGGGESLGVAF